LLGRRLAESYTHNELLPAKEDLGPDRNLAAGVSDRMITPKVMISDAIEGVADKIASTAALPSPPLRPKDAIARDQNC
jgi:hypothetical protein